MVLIFMASMMEATSTSNHPTTTRLLTSLDIGVSLGSLASLFLLLEEEDAAALASFLSFFLFSSSALASLYTAFSLQHRVVTAQAGG